VARFACSRCRHYLDPLGGPGLLSCNRSERGGSRAAVQQQAGDKLTYHSSMPPGWLALRAADGRFQTASLSQHGELRGGGLPAAAIQIEQGHADRKCRLRQTCSPQEKSLSSSEQLPALCHPTVHRPGGATGTPWPQRARRRWLKSVAAVDNSPGRLVSRFSSHTRSFCSRRAIHRISPGRASSSCAPR